MSAVATRIIDQTLNRVSFLLQNNERRQRSSRAWTAAFAAQGKNFITLETTVHEALVKEAMATGVEVTIEHQQDPDVQARSVTVRGIAYGGCGSQWPLERMGT
jgi:hypothetical protein